MTRILADLPEGDIKWLDARAAEQGKSRASVLRDAVSAYRAQSSTQENKAWIQRGRGYWKGREDIGDGLEYQQAIREDRPSCEDC
ncbi:MAG: CopG family transcriptional regulator [Novosphingobium sp.]